MVLGSLVKDGLGDLGDGWEDIVSRIGSAIKGVATGGASSSKSQPAALAEPSFMDKYGSYVPYVAAGGVILLLVLRRRKRSQ